MRHEKMDITVCVFTSLAAEPHILEKIRIHPGLKCLSGDLIPDGMTAENSPSWILLSRVTGKKLKYRQKVKVFCLVFYCEGSQTQ